MNSEIRKGPIACVGVKLGVNGVTGSRAARFDDNDNVFSPAGVDKLLHSKKHLELFKAILDSKQSFNVILSGASSKACQSEKKKLSKLSFAAVEDARHMRTVLVTIRETKEYVAVFNDRFSHTELAIKLGIAKSTDTVLISFFMFCGEAAAAAEGGSLRESEPRSGGLTCLISINADDTLDDFIAKIGERVSYETWCCGGCGIVTDRRLKCGVCRGAVYCSKECQRSDWASHKLVCL